MTKIHYIPQEGFARVGSSELIDFFKAKMKEDKKLNKLQKDNFMKHLKILLS